VAYVFCLIQTQNLPDQNVALILSEYLAIRSYFRFPPLYLFTYFDHQPTDFALKKTLLAPAAAAPPEHLESISKASNT
jgi:hypothetical protein